MTRKVIILTKRRPSEAVQRWRRGVANTTEFHGFCLAPTPPLLPPRSIPLTSSSFVPTYCWFEAYMQCAVCSRPLGCGGGAAPPRYGCALNTAASSQSRVCSNFLEVKSRFSYAKLFAVSGGDFNEERTIFFLCRRSSERVLQL